MANREENIDRFVKKVISHYDVRYDEAHWQALEKQLDAEMPVGPIGSTGTSIPTIIISALGGMALMLGILWMSGSLDGNQETDQLEGEGKYLSETSSFDSGDKTDAITDEHISRQKSEEERIVKSNNLSGSTRKDNSEVFQQDVSSGPSLSKKPIERNHITDRHTDQIDTYYSVGNLDRQGNGVSVIDVDSRLYHHDLPVNIGEDMMVAYPTDQSISPEYLIVDDAEELMERKPQIQFGIALGVAPDFNGVGMQSDKTMSGQVGMQVFATFRKRLTLTTGVFYGTKKYTAEGENYYPPNDYWNRKTNGVIPMEVIGTSKVIDVPINLTYNWNPDRRLQFLTSLGVSSYYILNEDCWYKFHTYNPGAESGWDSQEMVKEMFGVGNISLGILWYMKPKIALKVEPYLKVPFKDFGWGKINLYSAGSLISVQYTFN